MIKWTIRMKRSGIAIILLLSVIFSILIAGCSGPTLSPIPAKTAIPTLFTTPTPPLTISPQTTILKTDPIIGDWIYVPAFPNSFGSGETTYSFNSSGSFSSHWDLYADKHTSGGISGVWEPAGNNKYILQEQGSHPYSLVYYPENDTMILGGSELFRRVTQSLSP